MSERKQTGPYLREAEPGDMELRRRGKKKFFPFGFDFLRRTSEVV